MKQFFKRLIAEIEKHDRLAHDIRIDLITVL